MADLKKLSFSKSAILKKKLRKFHRLVLGLVGLIDTKSIEVLAVRLSDVSWATSMPLHQSICFWKRFTCTCKIANPSSEHAVYQNCSECQNKTKTTICVHDMFCRYSELTIFMNNEQSVVILWVSWCKNKSFWQRFTCNGVCRYLAAWCNLIVKHDEM